jgi:hypothetical protein
MRRMTALPSVAIVAALGGSSAALADGTETLGTPSIQVAAGDGILAAGKGMHPFPTCRPRSALLCLQGRR